MVGGEKLNLKTLSKLMLTVVLVFASVSTASVAHATSGDSDMNVSRVAVASLTEIDVAMPDINLQPSDIAITDNADPASTVTVTSAVYGSEGYRLTLGGSGISYYDTYTLTITKPGYVTYTNPNVYYGTLATAADLDLIHEPNMFNTYSRAYANGVLTIGNDRYAANALLYPGTPLYTDIDTTNGETSSAAVGDFKVIGAFVVAPDGAKGAKSLSSSGTMSNLGEDSLIDSNPNYKETVASGRAANDNNYWETIAFAPVYAKTAIKQNDSSWLLNDPADRLRIIEWYDNADCLGTPIKVVRFNMKVEYNGTLGASDASEVTAYDSHDLAYYMSNPTISTINLVSGTTYEYNGGTINGNLTINGNGAVIEAGTGVDDTIVRSDDITVDIDGLPNYAGKKTFLRVEHPGSSLRLNNVTLQNGNNGIFAVINVKTGGRLVLDQVTLKGFHNNLVPGENLSFGIHAEPGAVSTTITNSTFDSSNAFRNAIAIRGGALQINGNTFEGTDYPERLRQSDGYEYAMYIYGGSGTITQNVITGYDSTTQLGYASAGISVIGLYSTDVTITDNALSYNESGIDVTQKWTPYTTNTAMTVNGITLVNADDAYQMGEALRAANTQDYVSVSFNQSDEVEIPVPGHAPYYTVLGGYRSPYLTTSDATTESVTLHFPSSAADTDILTVATGIELQSQMDDETAWTVVTPTWTGIPTAVTQTLLPEHTYRFRAKLTHQSSTDAGDPVSRTLITYSAPVTVMTYTAPTVSAFTPADNAGNVGVGANLRIVFNKNVTASAGKYVVIKKSSDDSVVETIEASDTAKVTISGASVTINPSATLQYSSGYYVQIDAGAFKTGNAGYAGISDKTSWNFTTAAAPVNTTPDKPKSTGVDVLVNGKVESAGTATVSEVNGQSVTTVVVDEAKLQKRLDAEGDKPVITIPVNTQTDVVVGELNGQMVKNMESKQAVVEIRTEKAAYTLPARQLNIDAISAQLGGQIDLQDIKVRIEIAEPQAGTIRVVENAAKGGGFALVVPPLEFTVSAVYGDQTAVISKFNAYVERTVAIPDGIDPNKITTGVVVEPDGTVRHVPTRVVKVDGKYYAKINSLTNSTYTVVWHPLEFEDVSGHWAKDAVNNMGSRMVIEGVGDGRFSPDRDITRAEFAAIIVRGLGLKLENGASSFTDVKATDWYNGAIRTANAYGLIEGFDDGTFRPNAKITREQAMVMIAKAMILTELKDPKSVQADDAKLRLYSDAAEASHWAQSSIEDCLRTGVVTGRSGSMLAPKAYMTRAEVAVVVQTLLRKSNLI